MHPSHEDPWCLPNPPGQVFAFKEIPHLGQQAGKGAVRPAWSAVKEVVRSLAIVRTNQNSFHTGVQHVHHSPSLVITCHQSPSLAVTRRYSPSLAINCLFRGTSCRWLNVKAANVLIASVIGA